MGLLLCSLNTCYFTVPYYAESWDLHAEDKTLYGQVTKLNCEEGLL